jgi:hypothetical protein
VDCTLAVLLSFVVEVAIHKVSASCSLALVGASEGLEYFIPQTKLCFVREIQIFFK